MNLNVEQLLFYAFFDVMHIFDSVERVQSGKF